MPKVSEHDDSVTAIMMWKKTVTNNFLNHAHDATFLLTHSHADKEELIALNKLHSSDSDM